MVRPPKHPDHKRSSYLQLRMTADEKACMRAGAKLAIQPLSKFIRTAAMEKATLLTQANERNTKKPPADTAPGAGKAKTKR